MSQHTHVDAVIVGYGPVGQYLSYKLGRLGWTSVCIERFPTASLIGLAGLSVAQPWEPIAFVPWY